MQQETQFKQRVQKDLKEVRNSWFFKTQQRSLRGIPDIIGCVNGMMIAMELKTEKGKVSPLQEHILSRINSAKGIGILVTPTNWPKVLTALKILGQGGKYDPVDMGTN